MYVSQSDSPRTHESQKHVLELDGETFHLSSCLYDRLGSNLLFDRWATFLFQ